MDLLGDINSPILVSTIITDLVQTKEPVGNLIYCNQVTVARVDVNIFV